jgi:hypothetical protein
VGRGVPGDVVDEEGADGGAVVGAGDGAEVLLAGSVPDLQLDDLLGELDGLGCELDADGHVVLRVDLLLHELLHHARLAHACLGGEVPVSPITMNLNR